MKRDLDRLMQARGLAAFIVTGGEDYSDIRDYMSNGAHISGGFIVKKLGAEPLLIVNNMEVEEAKKSGYPVMSIGECGYFELLKAYPDDLLKATVLFWGRVLAAAGVTSGTVGVYGKGEIHLYSALLAVLNAELDGYRFVGELADGKPTLFQEAYLTKDADELARIHSVAERTNAVMAQAWDFIASHRAGADETVVDANGVPLTIGAVKRFVRRALLDVELEDTQMIFAQGRDAGFPHSHGEDAQPLKLGQSIVFDLFPRELGGGYYHDMTRTWCIGYAPPAVQRAYEQVMTAFDIAVKAFALGRPTHEMQEAVLDYFEAQGHPTQRTDNNPTRGYVHSLGHGLGLNVHEAPSISHLRRHDVFEAGNFITIEPGLYYPDEGWGVRVEDAFIVTDAGELRSITPFKKDLVLPLHG